MKFSSPSGSIKLLRSPTGERIKFFSPSGSIKLLRSPTGERIKFFSPSGSTRNTKRIPEGALPMRRPYACPARALPGAWFLCSGSKNAPCPCGHFELLSSPPAPALRAVEFFEATKKSFKFFFSEPLLNIERTTVTPPPPLRYKAFEVSYWRTNKILFSLR